MFRLQPLEGKHPEEPFYKYLSKGIQSWIEQHYYARIDAHARLEYLLHDPTFIENPYDHSSLYSDHGSIHARDVARNILQVLDCANNVLISARDFDRLEFMKGYGIQVAYVHDIALYDFSAFGRKMHPYAVVQKVLSPEFDDLVQAMWDENAGNVPSTLANLLDLEEDPKLVFREMLALAVGHSKSAFSIDLLSDPGQLRIAVQSYAIVDLQDLFFRMHDQDLKMALPESNFVTCPAGPTWTRASTSSSRLDTLRRYYYDFQAESFRWLLSQKPAVRHLFEDVSDTLRALRCADALRQRGTTLKTSGNYEIFVDRKTGNAIIAIRNSDQDLILLEILNPISAGEANLASCELTKEGDLRASFHRGSFPNEDTIQKAVSNAVAVLTDIYKDVIKSFQRFSPPGYQKDWKKDAGEMEILLENVNDNPEFALMVQVRFQQCNPSIQNPIRVVPSLKDVSERERQFYLEAEQLDWDDDTRIAILERIAQSGHKTGPIDPHLAFQDVKQITIQAGTTLIEAGAQPGFVYIPLSGSLKVIPLGGYPPFLIQCWMPLGITAVIRGSVRNATVVVHDDTNLLMIPQEIYLNFWHHTYDVGEFIQWMESEKAKQAGESPNDMLRLSI